jgi:DNA-binding beta-propeller fold protein YncE
MSLRKKTTRSEIFASILLSAILAACTEPGGPSLEQKNRSERRVGRHADGAVVAPTLQTLRPAGFSVEIPGRPRDLALSPDGRFLFVKNLSPSRHLNLSVIDVARRAVIQALDDPTQTHSFHGMAVSRDGRALYTTTDEGWVREANIAPNGSLSWGRKLAVAPRPDKSYSGLGGIALDEERKLAYVCVSRANRLAVIDLVAGREVGSIPVGVAPYTVILHSRFAYVSNWGGRRPQAGERQSDAQGIAALVDERGIASSGTISVVDLNAGRQVAEVATGLHPTGMALDQRANILYTANANDDSVSVIHLGLRKIIETIGVRPDPKQPFGSAPNALALSSDGNYLYVANGGNNAVAVIRVGMGSRKGAEGSRVEGFIPTGWYPAAVIFRDGKLFIANLKGWGSLDRPEGQKGFHVSNLLGTITVVDVPERGDLALYTQRTKEDAGVALALRASEKSVPDAKAVPLPRRPGEPSVFDHVVYVIKENRTYDQILGDLTQGNGDASLCIFGREITPNHHALAEEFVLLDNFYCNSLYSADGHAWITEANASDYMEKSRANLVWGNNPLSYSSSGFLWTHVLNHGLTFQNFGEFDYASYEPAGMTYVQIFNALLQGKVSIRLKQNVGIAPLRAYTVDGYPGWNLDLPDTLRADIFIKKLKEYEASGSFPNFIILYLPDDHTAGTAEGKPTPRAYLAQNDLALGRSIEALTRSRFWPKTCIFVVEDDPQDGFDHVDGHRTVAFVISPYTRRRAVISERYNQTSMVRSIELILGLPPMTQFDAMSPAMWEVFMEKADLTPYTAKPARVPLAEVNPPRKALGGGARYWAEKSRRLNLARVDAADEGTLNRILWHAMKGAGARYPEEFTGPATSRRRNK